MSPSFYPICDIDVTQELDWKLSQVPRRAKRRKKLCLVLQSSKYLARWQWSADSQRQVKYVTEKDRVNRKKDTRDIRASERREANAFWCKLCNKLISDLICSFLVASQTAEIRPSRHLGTKGEQWIFSTAPYLQNELRGMEINSIKRQSGQSSCWELCLAPWTIAFEVFLCFL